ncbi:MAG: hypothetical protein KGQ49_00510 [Verrucomicrobia bacterium]|nr:hypothetical protein [Verrucomicrobiota bacterium]MBU6445862.1 hypothetical protein [Verrucomicrobiota bacterium]
MKYENLASFQKHLASAAPHHLCRHYLIAIADDFERCKAFDRILGYLQTLPTRLSADKNPLLDCLDAMQSMSLLGESIVVLDEVEKFSKKEVQTLADHLPGASGFVLMGARSKVAPLAAAVEKEGVVLDLLGEKPWDREKRLSAHLIERAKQAGKQLGPDVPLLLLERLGAQPALLDSEIDKLICYVGDQPVIARADVLAISPHSKESTLWQQAEEVVWEGKELPLVDATAFHGLIPALRSQFHTGLCLATLIEEKRPADEWGAFLPKLWPKTLEKRSSQAARLGSTYFRKGLDKLFEIELMSRTSSTQYSALLELFRAHAR